MINNYKTRVYYYGNKDAGYDMITNYTDSEMPYWNIMNQWYNGDTYEFSK